jgi:hypothetical protein
MEDLSLKIEKDFNHQQTKSQRRTNEGKKMLRCRLFDDSGSLAAKARPTGMFRDAFVVADGRWKPHPRTRGDGCAKRNEYFAPKW